VLAYYLLSLASGFAGFTALAVRTRRGRSALGLYAFILLALFSLYMLALNLHFFQRAILGVDDPLLRSATMLISSIAMGGLLFFMPRTAMLYVGRRIPKLASAALAGLSLLPVAAQSGYELVGLPAPRLATDITYAALYLVLCYSLAFLVKHRAALGDPKPIIVFLAAVICFQAIDSATSGLDFSGYPVTTLPLGYLAVNVALVVLALRPPRGRPAVGEAGQAEALLGAGLTKRELEIASLLCAGKPYKEIALDLAISVSTVKNHISSILRKTGAKNRIGLAAMMNRSSAGSAPPSP
jgi:DNA-binding CsgD family transcriptional regulator